MNLLAWTCCPRNCQTKYIRSVIFNQPGQVALVAITFADFAVCAKHKIVALIALDQILTWCQSLLEQKMTDEPVYVGYCVDIVSGVIPVDG